MNVISNILYWISTGLLVPVIVLLIFFFFRALLLIGMFFGEYIAEHKTSSMLDEKLKHMETDEVVAFIEGLSDKSGSMVIRYMKEIVRARDSMARVEMLVADYELAAEKNIALPKVMTKMGPILGLMGTLIPMGPALVGLAAGDIASMAYNMQVAFATTVVGMVVSAVGFITQQVKERWAFHSLTLLDFVVQTIKEQDK